MHRDFTNYEKYYLCKLAEDDQKLAVYCNWRVFVSHLIDAVYVVNLFCTIEG